MGTRKTTHVKKKGKRKMNRERINEILAEAGIDTATAKAAVTNLLNEFNAEKRNIQVEAANKALEDFKDWRSPEEWDAREQEIQADKDEQARVARTAKFKDKKILDKYHNLAEQELKDSEDFDTALDAWVKDHQELCEATKTPAAKQGPKFEKMSGSGKEEKTEGPDSDFNRSFREALGMEA